jgi:hypothetical protein
LAAAAGQHVVPVVAGNHIIAGAAARVLDVAGPLIRRPVGHVGERNIAGHSVRAGERARLQIERDAGPVAREIEPIVDAATVPDRELRIIRLTRHRNW